MANYSLVGRTNRPDPTPEEIAAWKASFVPRTSGHNNILRDDERANAAFNAWLADPEDTRPLAAVEATNATD